MSHQGKQQLIIIAKATSPELEREGDRLTTSHAAWMKRTHPQDGELALLSYNVSKSPEFSNPFDPSSAPTGSTYFAIHEIYATPAGVGNHWQMGQENWPDFGAMVTWLQACDSQIIHGNGIIHALW